MSIVPGGRGLENVLSIPATCYHIVGPRVKTVTEKYPLAPDSVVTVGWSALAGRFMDGVTSLPSKVSARNHVIRCAEKEVRERQVFP